MQLTVVTSGFHSVITMFKVEIYDWGLNNLFGEIGVINIIIEQLIFQDIKFEVRYLQINFAEQ